MADGKNLFVEISKAMAEAVSSAEAATVLVKGRRRMPSSGVAFSADLVLTADHSVERDESISVVLSDGEEMAAEVAGRDPGSDLALLRLPEGKATPATVATEEAQVGEFVLALGRPKTSGIEASLGVISAINGPVRTRRGGMIEKFVRTDAIPMPGFSGGPLVNAEGKVLGINTSGLSHSMLLSIPVEFAWRTAETLAEHGSIKRGYLGIQSQLVEVPADSQDALGRSQASGLLLTHIEKDSPAAESGLMLGDIIVGMAGTPVRDHDTLLVAMSGDVVGKPAPVEVIRGGQKQIVDVTIGEREPHQRKGRHGRRSHRRHHKR